jgi:RNA polymerase sigma-70 factor (ECF subfamily)
VALGEVEGPAAALAEIEALGADRRLAAYQPYWATRGAVLAGIGRRADARDALTTAIGLSADDAVRRYLARQRDELGLAG